MKEFLESILGTYTPVTYTDYILDADGTLFAFDRVADGLSGIDYLYVLSGVAFIVAVYCVLKCIGGLICKIS